MSGWLDRFRAVFIRWVQQERQPSRSFNQRSHRARDVYANRENILPVTRHRSIRDLRRRIRDHDQVGYFSASID